MATIITFIGRVDDKTGEILPTDGRGRKKKDESVPAKRGSVSVEKTARSFYGATYLMDAIGENWVSPRT